MFLHLQLLIVASKESNSSAIFCACSRQYSIKIKFFTMTTC
eukprot:UN05955